MAQCHLHRHGPVDPVRQLFRADSVSKVFTATAVMQQVQQGRSNSTPMSDAIWTSRWNC
jgi:CubicO group peptidase (beta-lactamase class C family)